MKIRVSSLFAKCIKDQSIKVIHLIRSVSLHKKHTATQLTAARCPRMSLSGHLVLLWKCAAVKNYILEIDEQWIEEVGSRCINTRQLLGWASVTIYSTYCESVLGGPVLALMMTTSLKMYFHHPISSWHHRVAPGCWWIASQDWPLTMM